MVEKVATLAEIETLWSLADVLDANHALDAVQAAERELRRRSLSKAGQS